MIFTNHGVQAFKERGEGWGEGWEGGWGEGWEGGLGRGLGGGAGERAGGWGGGVW